MARGTPSQTLSSMKEPLHYLIFQCWQRCIQGGNYLEVKKFLSIGEKLGKTGVGDIDCTGQVVLFYFLFHIRSNIFNTMSRNVFFYHKLSANYVNVINYMHSGTWILVVMIMLVA